MLDKIVLCEKKLLLFIQDIDRGTLHHFPTLLKHCQENNMELNKEYFKTTNLNMKASFSSRFNDFKNCNLSIRQISSQSQNNRFNMFAFTHKC